MNFGSFPALYKLCQSNNTYNKGNNNDYDYDNANDINIDIDKHNRNHNNRRCNNAQLTLEARQRTPILFQFCARQKNTAKQQKQITVHTVGPRSCFAG